MHTGMDSDDASEQVGATILWKRACARSFCDFSDANLWEELKVENTV